MAARLGHPENVKDYLTGIQDGALPRAWFKAIPECRRAKGDRSVTAAVDEDAAEVVAETFDITDRNLPIARDHIRNYRRDSMQNDDAQQDNYQTNILSTDQDTIIDQDDDVAEECSAEQDHIQGQ